MKPVAIHYILEWKHGDNPPARDASFLFVAEHTRSFTQFYSPVPILYLPAMANNIMRRILLALARF